MTSIIILCHNQLEFTKQCLKSLFDYTSEVKTKFEVIVVNNASTDGTKDFLDGYVQQNLIKVIHSPVNLGFPGGNNAGYKLVSPQSEYICLCNNDILFTKEWLDKLLRCIKSDSQIAAVGPYSSMSSGRQQSPVKCNYKDDLSMQAFALKFSQEDKYTDFLVFFCVLIKRKVWDEIGGIDEDLGLGNFDDNLFCWKAVDKGYKLKICGNAFIHHWGSQTFKSNPQAARKYASLLACNQKIYLRKIGHYKKISLCMIVADYEKPSDLYRALDSIAEWMDEVNIVFNFKYIPNWINFLRLLKTLSSFKAVDKKNDLPQIKYQYIRFKDYASARNKSLEMATGDYVLWMDCDDFFMTPSGIRDLILYNPDIDVFKGHIKCPTEIHTEENIIKNILFKNNPKYRFEGIIHEDISASQAGGKYVITDLSIQHFGYTKTRKWVAKNKRNYKYLTKEIKANPDIMTYYHLVNCLMVLGRFASKKKLFELSKQSVKLIDEALEKFKPKQEDPITPKLWTIRGACCLGAGQILAAKQSFHKAYDEWRNLEAAVQLGGIYLKEKNYDKVIEILKPIYALNTYELSGIPIDVVQVECAMLKQLGDAYYLRSQKNKDIKDVQQAEVHYREFISIRADLQVMSSLATILRLTKRMDEANCIDAEIVNRFPNSSSWYNLAQTELIAKRYITARLFLREAAKYNKAKDIKHNLKMCELMLKQKGYNG
jgi:GT2 family glycosyltransferase